MATRTSPPPGWLTTAQISKLLDLSHECVVTWIYEAYSKGLLKPQDTIGVCECDTTYCYSPAVVDLLKSNLAQHHA